MDNCFYCSSEWRSIEVTAGRRPSREKISMVTLLHAYSRVYQLFVVAERTLEIYANVYNVINNSFGNDVRKCGLCFKVVRHALN